MTKSLQPPAPEDLPELYVDLMRRLERVEGLLQQVLAERSHDSISRPTWQDIERLRTDLLKPRKTMRSEQ